MKTEVMIEKFLYLSTIQPLIKQSKILFLDVCLGVLKIYNNNELEGGILIRILKKGNRIYIIAFDDDYSNRFFRCVTRK